MLEFPLVVKGVDGKKELMCIFAHMIGADIPFLIGRRTLEEWKSKVDTVEGKLEVELNGMKKMIGMMITEGGHYGLKIGKDECKVKEGFKEKEGKKAEKERRNKSRDCKIRRINKVMGV